MKKLSLISLLFALPAMAQEVPVEAEVPPFWQDTTFLLLAGGAVLLIIVLIVKKIMDRRGEDDEYENTSTQSEF